MAVGFLIFSDFPRSIAELRPNIISDAYRRLPPVNRILLNVRLSPSRTRRTVRDRVGFWFSSLCGSVLHPAHGRWGRNRAADFRWCATTGPPVSGRYRCPAPCRRVPFSGSLLRNFARHAVFRLLTPGGYERRPGDRFRGCRGPPPGPPTAGPKDVGRGVR